MNEKQLYELWKKIDKALRDAYASYFTTSLMRSQEHEINVKFVEDVIQPVLDAKDVEIEQLKSGQYVDILTIKINEQIDTIKGQDKEIERLQKRIKKLESS